MKENVKKIIGIWGVVTLVIGATFAFASGNQEDFKTKRERIDHCSPIETILGLATPLDRERFDNTLHVSTRKQSVGLSPLSLDLQAQRAGIRKQENALSLDLVFHEATFTSSSNNQLSKREHNLYQRSPLYLIGLGGSCL